MTKEIDIRRGRHCTFLMHIHLLFVAKCRRKIFDQEAIERLHGYFASVCADFDVELVEMDGEGDHVHLLVNYPPKLAVSTLVNSLKGGGKPITSPRSARYSCTVLLQGRSLDTELLCGKLWRSANIHHSPIYRVTANTKLAGGACLISPP